MHDFELEQLRRNPAWGVTLQTYLDLQKQGRAASPEFDGWVPRVSGVNGVDPSRLSNVHGRLIAFGFLKFDLSDRDVGMRYQLTPLARLALGAAEPAEVLELAESA